MKTVYSLITMLLLFSATACKKQDEWLDAKLNNGDVVPETVTDFQALLDNTATMNVSYPAMGIVGCDNYYVTYATWQAAATTVERAVYTWASDVYQGNTPIDWADAYQQVVYANVALEGLDKAGKNDVQQWNNVKGSALFFRSYAFYNLLQLFAKGYDSTTANNDLGIQLRLSSDVNTIVKRSSTEECYQQITGDLKAALFYLPDQPVYQSRPGKQAGYALLARIYLDMEKYSLAALYADSALQIGSALYNFNGDISSAATRPFPAYPNNKEVIFYAESSIYGIASPSGSRAIIDTNLYKQYDVNDIRRAAFFRNVSGRMFFKGTYTGTSYPFAGLAINELYLIRAEANVRSGKNTEALKDLNDLLSQRFKTATYVSFSSNSGEDILRKIIIERRKELPLSSLRWTDLKRWNKDGRFATTLTRVLNDITYTLLPNDNKYVYPIPDEEIRLSGVPQNPR